MSNTFSPVVSVILPVYNAGDLLPAAVQSILDQTYQDFELIIINDGSTDNSWKELQTYRSNSHVRLFEQPNIGLIGTLNRGISLARGQYVARMDQDDRSLPERLTKQVAFLQTNSDVGILGTTFAVQSGERIASIAAVLLHDPDIRAQLLFKCPFAHGTVMFRRSLERPLGGNWYASWATNAEDYELWSRIARHAKLANLPEPLYIWRDNPSGISSSRSLKQEAMRKRIAMQNQQEYSLRSFSTSNLSPAGTYRNEPVRVFSNVYLANRANNFASTLLHLAWIRLLAFRLWSAMQLTYAALRTVAYAKPEPPNP